MISNNLNCLWQPRMSILSLADFTIFNQTYDTTNQEGMCIACSGTGGFITSELIGDPPMTSYQDTFEACSDCIGNEKCPGCGAALSLSFDLSGFDDPTKVYNDPELFNFITRFDYIDALGAMPFEGFTCNCCSWQYDPECHYDQDSGDDYYEEYDQSDYGLPY